MATPATGHLRVKNGHILIVQTQTCLLRRKPSRKRVPSDGQVGKSLALAGHRLSPLMLLCRASNSFGDTKNANRVSHAKRYGGLFCVWNKDLR
jgi:hypothetical protein